MHYVKLPVKVEDGHGNIMYHAKTIGEDIVTTSVQASH